jgi:hypothetical protein
MSDHKIKCQNCSGHIEFDASGFAPGERRTVECPHCHLDTLLFVQPPADISDRQPKTSAGFRDWIKAVPRPKWLAVISTTKFERLVFRIIRGFVLFWSALVVLLLLLATLNYLLGFFAKATDGEAPSFTGHLLQSEAWQRFGIYMGAVFFLLFILTVISIVLLLLAIERNTRKDKIDVA